MKLTREKLRRMFDQNTGQVILGGGGGDVDLTGVATEAWVEENYISKQFFGRLFTIHSASSVIDPNDPDEEQTIDSIEALVGLWTEQYLSALGQGSGGGGGGGGITLNDPLDAINSAGLSDPVTAGSALVWYGGAWTYSPSARLQVAGLNSSAAVSVTGSVTATSFVRQGGTSSMFLKADGSVDTTVYAAQDWVNQNFITIAFFETLFNAVDANGTKVNANTTTGIDSIKAMFGFWTNQYLSALGQGSGGGGGGVTLNQPLSSINSAGLGAPSVSGSTLVWNGSTWTYSSSIGDTKNTAGSSQQPSGVQLYLIGASAQATWGVTYSNSGCYIGTDGYLYSGGSKVLTSANIPLASTGTIGGILVKAATAATPTLAAGSTADRYYGLQIDGNGVAFVNVPWTDTDTKNTAGAGTLPTAGTLYLVGAPNYDSDWQQTYTNSGCYISADGYLYSGGHRVLTDAVQTITINSGTPISPTNGNVNINCLTSISSSDVTTALGFTPAASSDLENYVALSASEQIITSTIGSMTNGVVQFYRAQQGWSMIGFANKKDSNTKQRLGYIGFNNVDNLVYYTSDGSHTYKIFHEGNLTSSAITTILGYTPSSSDTQNTAGATSGSGNALYIVGAKTQDAHPITYTNSNAYIDASGYLYSGGVKVLTSTSGLITTSGGTITGESDVLTLNNSDGGSISLLLKRGNNTGWRILASNGNFYLQHVISGASTNALIINETSQGSTATLYGNTIIHSGNYTSYFTDTKNTTGSTHLPDTKLFLIGATEQSANPITYSNVGCYIGTDNLLYLNASSNRDVGLVVSYDTNKMLYGRGRNNNRGIYDYTVGWVVGVDGQGSIFYNGGIAWSRVTNRPTKLSDFTNDSGFVTSSDLSSYVLLSSTEQVISSTISSMNNGVIQLYRTSNNWSMIGFANNDNNNNKRRLGYIGFDGVDNFIFYNALATAAYTIYHAGNLTSSVVTGALGFTPAAASDLSNYLPLGGGTLSNANYGGQLTIKRTGSSNDAVIRYENQGGFLGLIGLSNQGYPCFSNDEDGTHTYTLIHSGNYTSYFTDTKNTAGATAQPNSAIYLVGAGSFNSTYAVTYTNSGCYISADGYLYSGGNRVLTSAVQTITVNNGTPISPTNGNVNINCLTTSVTLWGQSFDGNGNVSGTITSTNFIIYDSSVNPYLNLPCGGSNWYVQSLSNGIYIGSTSTKSLFINSNGDVGIGTASPSYKLHIVGNLGVGSNITCHDLTVSTASGSTGSASIDTDLTVGSHVYVEKIGNGMTNMRFNTNGNVGIGVNNTSGYLLQVNGAVAGTSWTNLSDMRQKNYVEDESIELWQVANAPMFKFTWKNNAFGTDLHVGTSAQYWQTIVPEAVTTDGIGNLGLQYDVVALLAAITTAKKVQEHERRIEELERENKVLWNMIASLKAA